jgi:hypothetical protein
VRTEAGRPMRLMMMLPAAAPPDAARASTAPGSPYASGPKSAGAALSVAPLVPG